MLNDARAEPVIPISDRQRATDFYEKKLGLTLVEDRPELIRLEAGDGTAVNLYESVGAGQSRHTLAAFVVDDIDGVVDRLRQNGVTFEEYDMPDVKTEKGIATIGDIRGAWFKDPDGNIVSVSTLPGGS